MEDYITRGKRVKDTILYVLNKANIELSSSNKILDFGAGRGDALNAFLQFGYDAYGIDLYHSTKKKFLLNASTIKDAKNRYYIYSGNSLPFESNSYDFIYSWYVIEHIKDVEQSIKELIRVCKPGGYIAVFTQDARSGYEGHTKTPWPPFLASQFIPAYIDEYDFESIQPGSSKEQKNNFIQYMINEVFYVTEPELRSAFEQFGMRTIYSPEPKILLNNENFTIDSDNKARLAARKYKYYERIGAWKKPEPTEEINLIMQKIGAKS